MGRLGNQMFQYSVCRIISEKLNYNFYIPEKVHDSAEKQHIKNFFHNLELGTKDGEIKFVIQEDHTCQVFNPNFFLVEDFTKFIGFFQSPKYFKGYEEKIKSWFQHEPSEIVDNFLKKYDTNKYCYIHLRGTDYKNHNLFFLNKDYYNKAIDKINSIAPNLSFIVFTDDLKTSKEMFPEFECFSHADMMIDFQLLKNAKFNIIPNSTFSWWAAWLGKKNIVIAPNNWLNYNRPIDGFYPVDIKTDEFFYV
jgi:hypothetical protein